MKKHITKFFIIIILIVFAWNDILNIQINAYENITNEYVIEDNILVEYNGDGGDISIPDGVIEIDDSVFYGNTSITSVYIPDSVLFIGNRTFYKCTNLQSINLPSNLMSLGDYAFAYTAISEITIPKSLTDSSSYPFYNCDNLKSVTIEEGRKTIDDYLFANSGITKIELPSSVTKIGSYAFYNCENLTSIIFSDNLAEIDYRSFKNCISLNEVNFPQSLKYIRSEAFNNTGLNNLVIPENVVNIGSKAFYGCENLKSVNLAGNKSLTFGIEAFKNCYLLESFKFENLYRRIYSNQTDDFNLFENDIKLKEFSFPYSISIGSSSWFSNCLSLEEVFIPSTITSIPSDLFSSSPNVKIAGYSGSYAEKYASENNIPFKAIGTTATSIDFDNVLYESYDQRYLTIEVGETYQLKYKTNPEIVDEKPFYYSPSSYYSVSEDGVLKGLSVGEYDLEIRMNGNVSTVRVQVVDSLPHEPLSTFIRAEKNSESGASIYENNNIIVPLKYDHYYIRITSELKNKSVLYPFEFSVSDPNKIQYTILNDEIELNILEEGTYTFHFKARNGETISSTYTFILNGWSQTNDGKWRYYENGEPIYNGTKGWKKINNVWYYFINSEMQTGLIYDETGKYYYLKTNGAMHTGWQLINGKWYYFNNDMKTGWIRDNNKWYYLDNDGAMVTGWKMINGKWYYLNNDMKTGWIKDNNKWYYLSSNGEMLTGWQKVNDKWYYLNNDMKTGWQLIDNKWYYLNQNGVMLSGWQKINGSWYYLNNDMKTGWIKLNNIWYYLESNGKMVTGTHIINGQKYYFDQNGKWIK